jgi:aminoglycoside phosphotransferase (APT) family kinase protein
MGIAEPDPAAVLATIGWEARTPPVRITAGWDTLLWRFQGSGGRDHALRLYRHDPDNPRQAVAAAQEELSMRAARTGGLPVPEVEATGVYKTAPFFVLEWMPGIVLSDAAKSTPWRIPRLAQAFGAAQARLHRLPPPDGLLARGNDWLDRYVSHPALRDALKRESHLDTFCHLDYHPLNVLGRGSRLSGILDFGNAAIGDRRMDLAVTQSLLVGTPLPKDRLRPMIDVMRRLFLRSWRKGYTATAGDFPLDPLFAAFGAYYAWHEAARAVGEGRGWLSAEDVRMLSHRLGAALRAAGLSRPAPADL